MEVFPQGQATADSLLPAIDSDIPDNANTITQWLLSQPKDSRLQLAEAIFQRLLHEASQARQYHGNGHACVKLCSFVQQCAKSSDEALKQWAFTETVSRELFRFYLEWYEHDPHRALRLVLDVLVISSTTNPCPETGMSVKDHILETLVSTVARKSSRQLIKSTLQCLDHFLSKRVLDLTDISLKYKEVEPSVAHLPSLSLWRSFAFQLFSWMGHDYACPLAGKCLVHIFRGLNREALDVSSSDSQGFTFMLWREWLGDALSQNPEILEDIKNYVLAPIFKTDRDASLRLLQIFNRSQPLAVVGPEWTDQDLLLQLATLELGKKCGLVEEPSSGGDSSQRSTTAFVLHEAVLDKLLAHPSVSIRCSAFSLLVSSQATTKPFSDLTFDLLKRHLATFHSDYDAKVRNEVLGYTKNLIKRAKNIITVAQRSLQAKQSGGDRAHPPAKKRIGPEVALKDDSEARDVLDRHRAFLKWYMNFLKCELVSTASYQRHVTAIKATLLTVRIGKYAGAATDTVDEDIARMVSSDFTWIRLLLDLLLDPFDDVRESAATLLSFLPPKAVETDEVPKSNPPNLVEVLRRFCDRAKKLADRTGRADHGDGAARSQGLLCSWLDDQDPRVALLSEILERIEDKISGAEQDLGRAAIQSSIHADFAAASYVWQVMAKGTYPEHQLDALHHIQRRIFFCAQRIWLAVKHVLCEDSPEGHLPEKLEDIEGLDTKDLLSYSFRAVHESSNLLRLLIGTFRLKKAPGVPFPPLDVFRETGYLSFDQLASLRHRGAFSTVSYTFAACCQLTQSLRSFFPDLDDSENLLHEWYQGAINCIMTQTSTTRRSAGIPSLISAILSANAASPSFAEVYGTLEGIGKKAAQMSETDGSNLPQVHALNSLREVFRSSLLSKKAEGYLGRTLHLAATSLKSEVWAIRNCGLLLLRSLIDSLLGTGERKAAIESGWDGRSVRISYDKYPALPGVILSLLRSADTTLAQPSGSAAAEAVFPALDIIRRAGPPEEHRDELRRYIEGYLGSRLWHVREMAARTLCSFLLEENWAEEIGSLLRESGRHANRLHGALLTARFVIERKADLGSDLTSAPDSTSVERLLGLLAQKRKIFEHCAELQAADLEILNLLASLGCHGTDTKEAHPAEPDLSPALLELQVALKSVYDTSAAGHVDGLRECLLKALRNDVNVATRMLETIPRAWERADGVSARSRLCSLYLEVCNVTSAPELRARALTNLGALMDSLLSQGRVTELPTPGELDRLWVQLQSGDINPTLSCAIIETSGAIMATLVSCGSDSVPNLERRLRSWGDMISECLDVDNPFDARYAAAVALKSFFTGATSHTWDAKYLPALSALYDGLIDDDDDVRQAAAGAASGVIGANMVAPAAAEGLVVWLGARFGDTPEFRSRVVCRMAGQPYSLDVRLAPAEEQLRKAMDFDDSLFATEEQNLFIDEVRETSRWQQAFEALQGSGRSDPSFSCLREWTEAGLECLVGLVGEREDGPLGWTSDQHVFAVCARILLCAVAVTRTGGQPRVVELLREFGALGGKAAIHGSLLEMANLETVVGG